MQIRIAVENGNDGRSLAWALDHPGCFTYGPDESSVILGLPLAYLEYARWVERHTRDSWVKTGSLDIRLVEVWQCYYIDERYQVAEDGIEIDGWFRDDWRPLSGLEIERGKLLLTWSREDLLDLVSRLDESGLVMEDKVNPKWTIRRILGHIANAEWWYLDRLGLAPGEKATLPEDALQRLDFVRSHVITSIDRFAGLDQVVGKDGEFWSPRKVLRRLPYHERDHLDHIQQILAG